MQWVLPSCRSQSCWVPIAFFFPFSPVFLSSSFFPSLSVQLLGKFQCPPTRAFRCQNDRVCLQVSRRCDGVNNCGDNSDELNCRKLGSCFGYKISYLLIFDWGDADLCLHFCQQRLLHLFPRVRKTSSCAPMADASAPICAVTSLMIAKTMALMRSTAKRVDLHSLLHNWPWT